MPEPEAGRLPALPRPRVFAMGGAWVWMDPCKCRQYTGRLPEDREAQDA